MEESEVYGFTGTTGNNRVVVTTNAFGGGVTLSADDPRLRDRLIDYIESRAEEVADAILRDLDLEDETDYDDWSDDDDDEDDRDY